MAPHCLCRAVCSLGMTQRVTVGGIASFWSGTNLREQQVVIATRAK